MDLVIRQAARRELLNLAEARALEAGFAAIQLYTQEKMTENLNLYTWLGYTEFRRSAEKDFTLAYMRKQLG